METLNIHFLKVEPYESVSNLVRKDFRRFHYRQFYVRRTGGERNRRMRRRKKQMRRRQVQMPVFGPLAKWRAFTWLYLSNLLVARSPRIKTDYTGSQKFLECQR